MCKIAHFFCKISQFRVQYCSLIAEEQTLYTITLQHQLWDKPKTQKQSRRKIKP
jgi:hypothetical protein